MGVHTVCTLLLNEGEATIVKLGDIPTEVFDDSELATWVLSLIPVGVQD